MTKSSYPAPRDRAAQPPATAVSLAQKVAFLRSLGAPYGPVAVRETHMSWVFIGPQQVLKLKKPVRYPFLDFSTLAAREHNCREEVRLNRRLAPEVYLGVRALLKSPGGTLTLGERDQDGEVVVDWLVEMRRLPEAAMLDAKIADGSVTAAEIEAVGDRLARFYEGADRPDLDPRVYIARLSRQLAIDRAIITARDLMPNHGRDARLVESVEELLERHAPTLRERIEAGVIVEGHGDLRPEHICLTDPPSIIDCLEFNRSLRLLDPYDEIAYLDLECRRLGVDWIGPLVSKRIAARIGEQPPPGLSAFYLAFRALLRARQMLVHLLEPEPREPEKWQPLARDYLDLAEAALASSEQPGAR